MIQKKNKTIAAWKLRTEEMQKRALTGEFRSKPRRVVKVNGETRSELRQTLDCHFRGQPLEAGRLCACPNPPEAFYCDCPAVEATICGPTADRHGLLVSNGAQICAACIHRQEPRREIPPMTWAVGITASRRPNGDTLAATIRSLAAAGWPNPIVFADGDDFDVPAGVEVVRRSHGTGALQNFYSACAELLVRSPHAHGTLIAQDDVLFCKNTRAFIEAHPWPAEANVVKLFTHGDCEGPSNGWHEIPTHKQMKGAQAYVFPSGRLQEFVSSGRTLEQRTGGHRESNAIDNVVAYWGRDAKGLQVCITPSLAQHEGGDNSTLGHDFPRARSFPGEEFDAMELYRDIRPLVTAVMVTGKSADRDRLARLAVDAFYRQSYSNAELVIINDSDREILANYVPPTGCKSRTIREIHVTPGRTLGDLRNDGIETATGQLVIQWDDDDVHGPDRIALQVKCHRPGQATLLQSQLRLNLLDGRTFAFRLRGGICGTILHDRSTPHRYPSHRRAEDTVFKQHFIQHAIDNDPRHYVRLFHGANTWDAEHVMKPQEKHPAPTADERALLESISLLYEQTPLKRYTIKANSIEGWFAGDLVRLFAMLFAEQDAANVRGGVLEIGVHLGKSLLPLAALAVDRSEHVFAIDPFDTTAEYKTTKRWRRFQANVTAVFHTWPALLKVARRSSADFDSAMYIDKLGGLARLSHVDGNHNFEFASHDIREATAATSAAGIVAVDDVYNVAWPEVGMAFHEQREQLGLHVFAIAYNRVLCARSAKWATTYGAVLAKDRRKLKTLKGIHIFTENARR